MFVTSSSPIPVSQECFDVGQEENSHGGDDNLFLPDDVPFLVEMVENHAD